MTKTKIILFVGFLLTFGAGLVVGLLLHRPAPHFGRGGWLSSELNLTSAQSEQIHQIWAGAMGSSRKEYEDRHKAIRDQRDKALADLMQPVQREAYDKIMKNYSEKMSELNNQRRQAFQKASEQMKKLLTEDQRKKYEELLKQGIGRGRGSGRRHEESPSSRPVSD